MPVPNGQNCGNCTFIDFVAPFHYYGHEATAADGTQIGYCRAIPPRPAVHEYTSDRKSSVIGVEWPEVRADDWCGDWKTQ